MITIPIGIVSNVIIITMSINIVLIQFIYLCTMHTYVAY